MNKEYLLNLFKDCIFTGKFSNLNFEDRLIFQKDLCYDVRNGISKACILLDDVPYVLKIPFNFYEEEYDRDWYDVESEPFSKANNDNRFYWDYCLSEVLNYRKAKKEGVNEFFCKTRLLGFVNEHPIYIQQRAVPFFVIREIERQSERSKRMIDYCRRKDFGTFNPVWQAEAFNYYGKKKFDKLMTFLDECGIYDLHTENVGYIDDRPVIFDYSDFKED